MLAEWLQDGEEDAAIRCVDGTSLCRSVVNEVKHAIAARDWVVLLGQVIESHQVKQRDAFLLAFGEIAHRGAVKCRGQYVVAGDRVPIDAPVVLVVGNNEIEGYGVEEGDEVESETLESNEDMPEMDNLTNE